MLDGYLTIQIGFYFDLFVTVSLFCSLGSVCNLCFDFYRNPLNEILDNLKRLWSLKVLEFFKAYRT